MSDNWKRLFVSLGSKITKKGVSVFFILFVVCLHKMDILMQQKQLSRWAKNSWRETRWY